MLEAIHRELILRREEISDKVETVYFGGGTPSLLTLDEIEQTMNIIALNYELDADAEITLEANPDDLTKEKTEGLARSPVNRLSIGVQSFFEEDLLYMNRAHNASQARKSMEYAMANFDNISIDLIYGLPHLSEQAWLENLNYTFDLGVQHLSSYALTVEPQTALAHFIKKGKYAAPIDDLTEKHFQMLQKVAQQRGFIQYEISNFGMEGFFSKHNTSYWQGRAYLGIGPSAHSYNGTHRSWNVANNAKYMAAISKGNLPMESELLSIEDRVNETIMTGLRTIWGVSLDEIALNYGRQYKEMLLSQAKKFIEAGNLVLEGNRLLLKPASYFLADGISADLFVLKV